jgi:predicted lipoprotein with Yx(FWY)xxD motif
MLKLRMLVLVVCLLLVAVPVFGQDEGPTLGLGNSEELGDFLIGPNGMTLYLFTPDPLDASVCMNQCLENWPALTVESADAITVAEGIPGEVGTIEREDTGELQVTYNGVPLYYWVRDDAPGDTTGHRVGSVWWVVPPATAYASYDDELGSVLVGPTGMTLYRFDNDEPGVSNCYDDCATNWPPLTVESADAVVPGVNLLGEFGTTERTDGTLQVTYNGWPLYYFAQDAARGDTTGEARGDVWWTVMPETVGLSSSDELGDFLVSPDGMTLYMFTNDEAGVSNCADECAENWPPYTVRESDRLAAAEGIEGELATIERADGDLQVTYNGMPLYFYAEDAAPGDTTGQEVGDVWFVVNP